MISFSFSFSMVDNGNWRSLADIDLLSNAFSQKRYLANIPVNSLGLPVLGKKIETGALGNKSISASYRLSSKNIFKEWNNAAWPIDVGLRSNGSNTVAYSNSSNHLEPITRSRPCALKYTMYQIVFKYKSDTVDLYRNILISSWYCIRGS